MIPWDRWYSPPFAFFCVELEILNM
jgi:hypothetical protein